MASRRMTLIIDGVTLRGGGDELAELRSLLKGPRGAEQEVFIRIDPDGWQLTRFVRSNVQPFVRKPSTP